jgi:hypothetical protein
LNQLTTKSSLSPSQRQLTELCQVVKDGRIENVPVSNGEPSFDPPPRVIRKLKMGGDNAPRPEANLEDFWLKHQVIEMLAAIAELGNGKVLSIEVRHGLPFMLEIERRADQAEGLLHA